MAPKARPRPYTTLDREYLAQDTIRELGDAYGPAGPLVFLALILNAGKAITEHSAEDVGTVSLRWMSLAKESFTDVETARQVIGMARGLGLVGELLERPGGRFTTRLLKADQWESRAKTGAERQRDYRARQAEGRDA